MNSASTAAAGHLNDTFATMLSRLPCKTRQHRGRCKFNGRISTEVTQGIPLDGKNGVIAKMSVPNVLFQAPNSVGLGHISRLAAIALALRQEQPAIPCAFAISGFDHGLLGSLGLPWVSLPPVELLAEPNWRGWPPASRERLLHRVAESVIESLQPAAIVFDCIPHLMFLSVSLRRNIPFCFVARKTKSLEEYAWLESALDRAAAIIVPHERNEFVMPRQWENKTHYVGTILRQQRGSAETTDIGRLPEPRIVITGGGGGYQGTSAFYNLALEACRKTRQDFPTLSIVLVTGPLFQEWSDIRLNDTVLIPSCWDMLGLFRHAALVVCQAGYNTVAEVLQSGKPAISIPAERMLDDQVDRARLVASRHSQFNVLENPTVEVLSAKISSILQSGRAYHISNAREPSIDGATVAARIVSNVIRSRTSGETLAALSAKTVST